MTKVPRKRATPTDPGNPLAELQPEGLAPDDASWQERKRSDFRIAVLDAVIDCLAEHGYSATTTELVATRARVSRGTMLHRFPTRQSLIEAATEYAFFRRMQNFLSGVHALSEQERIDRNLGIQVSWRQYFTREYRAHLELHVAAKTDADLRRVFIPRAKLYDQIWRREVAKAFPEWGKDSELLDRTGEFVRAALEGIALNSDIWDDPEHLETLLQFVADTALALRERKLGFRARSIPQTTRPDDA